MSENLYKSCTLCPRRCGIDRTEKAGYCGVPAELYIARAALHPWEEPCICGEKGSGTVFFSGCSLHCVYCQNKEISHGITGKKVDKKRLVAIFFELAEKGAANINLVTPTHYTPTVAEAVKESRKAGLSLPIVYNSSGYELPETLKMLDGLVDVYLPDFKYFGTESGKAYSNCPDYSKWAFAAVSEMQRQTGEPLFSEDGMLIKGVMVRHLLLPGNVSESKAILRKLWKSFGDKILYSIMSQYTPVGDELPEALRRKVTDDEYEAVLQFAQELGIRNGYCQTGEAATESFIPHFDGEGV